MPDEIRTRDGSGLILRQTGAEVVLDIDFRPDQRHDPRALGVAVRSALRLVDIVLGTEDEANAAMLSDPRQISLTHSQVSDTKVSGDVVAAIDALVEKWCETGARIHLARPGNPVERIDAPGYPVEIYNILRAGNAFAAGFLYGHVRGWSWRRAARLGNACGAIVVMAHGCANFMPTYDEVMAFVAERGGL